MYGVKEYKELLGCRVVLSKAKLLAGNNIVVDNKFVEVIVDDTLEHFRDDA